MSDLVGGLILLTSVVMAVLACLLVLRQTRRGLPYPPGPKAYPIIGNLLDVPTKFQWKTYTEWGKKYGDIMHLTVLGQHIIIINSEEIAYELLEKRSKNYSDRPEIPIMFMNGWQSNMGLKHYGDEWRRDRRVLHQRLRREVVAGLHPMILSKARTLVHDLLRAPKDFQHHYELYPASIIMYHLYGHQAELDDPLVQVTFKAVWMFSRSVFPGTDLINAFPTLRYLPPWFPIPVLKELRERCDKCRYLLQKMQDIPFDSVKRHMAEGTAVPSWVSELLERNKEAGQEIVPEEVIKALGLSTFAAAMETSLAFLLTFTLAMVLFPEAQERAQAEIDSVTGGKRLPDFEDRSSLVYCEALLRELLRWHGPGPLGIPHAAVNDDYYNGYYIPKGATILYTQWAMWRDERVYSNAEEFRPERFLTPDGGLTDRVPPTFGFGRRVCVGRATADASIWIAMVSILSVFRIAKAKDELGKEIDVSEEFGDGIVSFPLPFECSITPRSGAAEKLIHDNPPMKLDSNPLYY